MRLRKLLRGLESPAITRQRRRFTRFYRIHREHAIDSRRYQRHSAPSDNEWDVEWSGNANELVGQLVKDYHRIEKALTLDTPRRPFGIDLRHRIEANLELAGTVQPDQRLSLAVQDAQRALGALAQWNQDGVVDDAIAIPVNAGSGWADLWSPEAQMASEKLFSTRRSVRSFATDRPIEDSVLDSVGSLLSNTPSVCNRQASKVYIYREPREVSRILRNQNGNAGFRDQVPAVAVITSNLQMFSAAGERNQRWVDGGLFAMSFVYALHSKGLASCMLNWSMPNDATSILRTDARIPDCEDVVVLVAFGYPQPDYRVARSPRPSVDSIMLKM